MLSKATLAGGIRTNVPTRIVVCEGSTVDSIDNVIDPSVTSAGGFTSSTSIILTKATVGSAGIWTNDLKQAHLLAGVLRAGTVWINCYNLTDPASPFGGMKQSGLGREMGRKVLDNYTETKSVWVNLT